MIFFTCRRKSLKTNDGTERVLLLLLIKHCLLIGRYSSFISAKLKLGSFEVLEAIHLKSALWITYHLLNQARIKHFSIKRLRNKYIRKRQIILVYE